jgi:hypothetical protein
MLLDLNDAESILTWWRVWPERHDANLEYFLQSSPQFAPAIREAQRRIAASPELNSMLANGVQDRRGCLAAQASNRASLSAYELRMAEFA